MKKFLMSLLSLCSPLLAVAQTNYTPQQGDKITTDNGIYIVSGQNLIENPSFDDGTTAWTAGNGSDLSSSNFSVETSGGADGGAYLKALGGAGSGSDKSIKTGWAIESGKTYLFSCWALRTQSGMSSNTQYSRIFESDSKTATTSQIGTINYVADTWTATNIVFTATKSYCVANLGWLNAASSFDCFFLGEVTQSDELATAVLEQTISEARTLYETTEEGDTTGQYTTAVRSAFADAINAANATLASATTQDEINVAIETLEAAISTYEASKNPPFKVGDQYVIRHRGSNLYLTTASTSGKAVYITAFNNDNHQIFTFDVAPEGSSFAGYNLHDVDGNYVYRSGSWNTFSGPTTLTEDNAIFNIVEDDEWYQLKNMGSGSVLGTDASSDGAYVYSNKNGTGVANYDWLIEEYSVTMAIDAAITQAEGLIAETTVGDEPGDVAQSAVDALQSAINTATEAKATVTTFEEAETVAATLQEAIETFKGSIIGLSEYDTTKIYAITHYSGNVLTATTSGNASITALASTAEDATVQQMTLEANGDMQYRIKNQSGLYLAKDGNYNTVWQADGTTTASLFQVVQLSGKYVGLMCLDNSRYLGTDSDTDGALLYSDKTGANNQNAYWLIGEYQLKQTADKTALDEAISTAQALAASMVQGWKQGEYYLSDIQAFSNIVAQAQAAYEGLTTQEQVDAATTQLTADIATYKAKAHAADVTFDAYLADLIPIYEAECNAAVVGDGYGEYTAEAKAAYAAAIDTARQTSPATQATVETLEQARTTFLNSSNKIDHAALQSEIEKATATLAAAKVGDCQGQYAQEAVDTYAAAIATAQQSLADETLTQEQVDAATAALTTAGTTFAKQVVVIDFSNLRTATSTAQQAMTDAEDEKGEGAGKYPQSAFDALQAVVDQVKAMTGSDTVNQATVDSMTTALTTATETFANSRVQNSYTDLQAAIDQAQALYDEWADRTDLNSDLNSALADLKSSIDRNSTALTSTDQTVIDRATKIMLRDIELFNNVTTGIGYISLDILDKSTAIYDLSGRRVSTPQRRNIYIVNGRKVVVK